jgi:hypothetical protein
MQKGEFPNQQALQEYAHAHGLAYVWEGMNPGSTAGTYELVEVRTKRGMTKALLFSKEILKAEFEIDAPLREAIRIKRERLRARREAKQSLRQSAGCVRKRQRALSARHSSASRSSRV